MGVPFNRNPCDAAVDCCDGGVVLEGRRRGGVEYREGVWSLSRRRCRRGVVVVKSERARGEGAGMRALST
jgi:hypothetical protein